MPDRPPASDVPDVPDAPDRSPHPGDVVPGGPSVVRRWPELAVRKASVSAQDNNAYLITCRRSGAQLLVDAADDVPRCLRLAEEGAQDGGHGVELVVTTHRHWDHHRALAGVLAATGARSAGGHADADHLPVSPDLVLMHGETIAVGELRIAVIGLRGHTPGGIALALHSSDQRLHLFSGDSLFPGGPGRTTSPEDFAQLMDDLEERVFDVLPGTTWLYPGHGRDSTLGVERPHLAEWRARGW